MATSSNTAAEKLAELRAELKAQGVQGFFVPRADEYQGEEVPDSAERLAWLSGFAGSAGMAAVLESKAAVVSDGRYTIQLQQQVDGQAFDLVNGRNPEIYAWVVKNAQAKDKIGYDPKLHTVGEVQALAVALKEKNIELVALDSNPLDAIWDDQPAPPAAQVTVFDEAIAGKSSAEKRQDVASTISNQNGAAFVMSMPDSIAWLLNIRGGDVNNTPLALSYAVMHESGEVDWYIDDQKISAAVRQHVGNAVKICDPAQLEADMNALCAQAVQEGRSVLMDYSSCPMWFYNVANNNNADVRNAKDPVIEPRACKTVQEQDAIRNVHERDGVALAHFLSWLDEEAPKGHLTEMDVADKLLDFRKAGAHFTGNSFDTISGWAANGAIVHYHATKASNATIKGDGLLLVDSGGQYSDGGTTDITRTVCVGTPTDSMKAHFTRALKGHIALARAVFPEGISGAEIDVLTRQALWAEGEDYAHGTGHGVGCYLSVHENGVGISSRANDIFRAGMLVSNEPGFYKENEYGIRIENLVLVQEKGAMNDGRMKLSFETVSLAPIDQRLIDASLMDTAEIKWLNDYHARVYKTISPHLSNAPSAQSWLKNACKPL
jgi:Xaa-Pro aminopeptidase